jgi:hypothetical protein
VDELELIKRRLERMSLAELRKLSERTGLSIGGINKIKYGITKNPGVLTLKALRDDLLSKAA